MYSKLVADGTIIPRPEVAPPTVPMDFNWARVSSASPATAAVTASPALSSCSTPLSKLRKGLAGMRVVAWLDTAPDSTVWETATTVPCLDRDRKQKSFRKDSGRSLQLSVEAEEDADSLSV